MSLQLQAICLVVLGLFAYKVVICGCDVKMLTALGTLIPMLSWDRMCNRCAALIAVFTAGQSTLCNEKSIKDNQTVFS